MSRKRSCEVCGESAGALSSLDDGGTRRIVLCQAHAERAAIAGATSAEAVRALFIEDAGRRALVSRRAEDERRVFPPRPEGRRIARGRRDADQPRRARVGHANAPSSASGATTGDGEA
jgi:hypothetical protein